VIELATDLSQPVDVVRLGSKVYVAQNNGQISVYDLASSTLGTSISVGGNLAGIIPDPSSSSHVLVSRSNTGRLVRVPLFTGSPTNFGSTGLGRPSGLAYDSFNDEIVVVDATNSNGRIIRLNRVTGNLVDTISVAGRTLGDIQVIEDPDDPPHRAYIVTDTNPSSPSNGKLLRVSQAGEVTELVTGIRPAGIAVALNPETLEPKIYVVNQLLGGRLLEVDLSGSPVRSVVGSLSSDSAGLYIESVFTEAFLVDLGSTTAPTGRLLQIIPALP